jgi:succinate dehydrogenase / fumarate reductase flavoprotein subunit
VALVSKVHPVRSHSVAAAGGINAAIDPADDWRSHAFDTVKGSDYLGDQDAIEIMCREGAEGGPPPRAHRRHLPRNEDGALDLRAFGGASMNDRLLWPNITGQAILHVSTSSS